MHVKNQISVIRGALYGIVWMVVFLVIFGVGNYLTVWAQREITPTYLTYTDKEHGISFLYPSDLTYTLWSPTLDILASTSFYASDYYYYRPNIPEISVTLFDNSEQIDFNKWISLHINPNLSNLSNKMKNSAALFENAGEISRLTIHGSQAVLFPQLSGNLTAGRLIIDNGKTIISITYTDFGNGGLKDAFAIMAASLQIMGSSGISTVDENIFKTVRDIINSYPSPSNAIPKNVGIDSIGYGYKLPWASGITHYVIQGWGGSYSHTCPGQMCYAYDFDMYEGEEVKASRGGTVSNSVGIYTACGGYDFRNSANRVTINHDDGSATLYLHLYRVDVSDGLSISQGDRVGLAGKTGWTGCSAHLHFQRQAQGIWITNSQPIYFDEYPGIQLSTGVPYISQNGGCALTSIPSGYNQCADEGGFCSFSGTANVIYGANSCYTSPRSFSNGTACNNDVFGDPLPGVHKYCYTNGSGGGGSWAYQLFDLGDYNGDKYESNQTITNLTNVGWNDRAESIKINSGYEIIACEHADFQGNCGRVTGPAQFSDINALAQGLRNGLSSIKVCAGSCPNPPAAPSLISPSDGQSFNEGESITLSWTATGSDYYGEIWGGPGGTLTFGWQSGSSKNIGSQWAGYTYYWHVKARNSVGESGWSNTRNFTVRPATPTNLSASAVSCSQINLSWNDNSGNEEGYKVYRNGAFIATLGSGATTYQDSGLSGNTNYSYIVKAYRGSVESNASNTANGLTPNCQTSPPTPNNFRVLTTTTNSITLAWDDVSGETGYKIYKWGYDGSNWTFIYYASVGANVTNYTDANLPCGNDFNYYELSAYNGYGESEHHPWIQGITDTCPPLPDLVPYPREGRQDPVIVSSVPNTAINDTLYAGAPVYFDWGYKNTGNVDINDNYFVDLYVDDHRYIHYPFSWMGSGALGGFDDWVEVWYSPGWHTVKLIVDPENTIAESDETNNQWSMSFYWESPPTSTVTYRSFGLYDGYVLESSEASNVGGSLNSTNTTFLLGDDNQDRQYRALLSFNTAGLPDNAVITKATLKIRQYGLPIGTNPFTTHGGLKIDIRKPFFGTTVNLAVGDFQAGASKSAVGTFNSTPVNNWYSAVLGNTAYPYINLTGITQFRLRFAKDDNDDMNADYLRFFSGNYSTASYRPTLIIEYYVPSSGLTINENITPTPEYHQP